MISIGETSFAPKEKPRDVKKETTLIMRVLGGDIII